MKQPLMLTPIRIPPAQAEALYDAYLGESERSFSLDVGAWPGEDWDDDDAISAYRPLTTPDAGNSRVAQH